MRALSLLAVLTLSAAGAACAGGPKAAELASEPALALVGATLVDGTGGPPVADAVVVVRDRRIACAGPRAGCPVPEGAERLDLAGRFVTPGLIDTHVHFSQTGWADGRPDALDVRASHPYPEVVAGLHDHPERFFRAYLCSGVTAVFDVGGYPWTLGLPERAEAAPAAPRVVAAGPLLSTLDHWLNLPAERQFVYLADEAAARGGVSYLAARGASAVKVWYLSVADRDPEAMRAAVAAAGEEAAAAGLPLIVHATELEVAKTALRAGAKLLVHSVYDQPVDEEFLALAKEKGTVYCPTLTVMAGYRRMFEAAAAGTAPSIDDPNGCIDAETRAKVAATAGLTAPGDAAARARGAERTAERERIAAENLRRVAAAGIPIALGTDAGNPLTLHGPSVYAELEAMEAAGMSAAAVLVAATRDAARALGREADLGTIEPGKAADLLVLAEDPTRSVTAFRSVERVVRGGTVHEVADLAARP